MPSDPDPIDPTVRCTDGGVLAPQSDGSAAARSPAALSAELLGRRIGKYLIRERLGGGGMGDVYLAEMDFQVGKKPVAIKTINPKYLVHADAVRRFQEEAYAAGTLQTNYVVQVHDFGVDPGGTGVPPTHYIVMELANAGTLASHVAGLPGLCLPADEAIRLLLQACEGLLAAERRVDPTGHADPLVHRDIKPSNLFLQRSDATGLVDMRIGDFGTVKRHLRSEDVPGEELSQHGAPMTPAYASPEQWLGEDVDHRSDMYSLGATFFQALTGQRATPETKDRGVMRQFALQTPFLSPRTVLDGVSEGLDRVIRRLTARHRKDRYPSFADAIVELRRLQQKPVSLLRVWLVAAATVAALGFLAWRFAATRAYLSKNLLADYESLERHLEDSRGTLPDLQPLELAGGFDDLLAQVRSAEADLRQTISDQGDAALVPKEGVERQAKLDAATRALIRQAELATHSWRVLADIAADLASRSHAHTIAALEEVTPVEAAPAIRRRTSELRKRTEELQAERVRRLDEVRQALAQAGDSAAPGALATLRATAERLRAELPRDDADLCREGDQLRAAIDAAIAFEAELPAWSTAGREGPAQHLRGLVEALERIRAISPPGDLAAWWRNRCQRLGADWMQSLSPTLAAALGSMDAQVAELRQMDRDSARERLATTQKAFRDLGDVLRRLDTAAASILSRDATRELHRAIDPFLGQPEPSLLFQVARLRSDYARCRSRAAVCAGCPTGGLAAEARKIVADADAAMRTLDTLQTETIADLPGHALPAALDKSVDILLGGQLTNLRQMFEQGRAEPSAIEAQLTPLEAIAGNGGYGSEAKALAQAVAMAKGLAATVPQVEPSAFRSMVDRFKQAVAAVEAIRATAEPDPLLGEWRKTWTQKRLLELTRPISAQLREVTVELRDTVAELQGPAQQIAAFAPEFWREVDRALRQIDNGAAIHKPADWTDEVWERWPHDYAVPAGMHARAEGDGLIGWFDCRRRFVDVEGQQVQPIEMVLVQPATGTPFLVDRHEVCVGELLALGVVVGRHDPGRYLERRGPQWNRIRSSPSALLSWTSGVMAQDFTQSAYAGNKLLLSLPSISQWQALTATMPKAAARGVVPRDTPELATIDSLDEFCGLRGLASGLAEWLADGQVVGATDYEPQSVADAIDRSVWARGVGFRCTLTLR